MKILWLSHLVPYPAKSGALIRAHYLLRETCRRHEVHLLTFHQPALMAPFFESAEQGLAEAREMLSECCSSFEIFDIPSERQLGGRPRLALRSLAGAPYTIRWLLSDAFRRAVRETCARVRPDLVHFDTISLVPYFDASGGAPAVLDHHNVESHLLLRRASRSANPVRRAYFWQEGKRLEAWERRWCERFAQNITCSDLDAQRLGALCPRAAFTVVPNPTDVEYFRPDPGRREDPQRLVFVGTLSWDPNRDAVEFIARELWPRLRAEFPGIQMDVVGAHPPETVVDLSRRDATFRVHGFVDDFRPIVDAAAVYLCPIRDGGGTKLKILDAFAMQKAVVADPIACEGIEVTDARDVLFARTPEEYVARIRELLSDPARRAAQGESARRLVETRYSAESIGRQLSDLFEACTSAGNALGETKRAILAR
jgi:glycosyltransferase involved in cell wall biosynthesis